MEALMATLMVFQRKDQKWLWHLEADNGDIVATDGGQGYDNYVEAQAMADKVVIQKVCSMALRDQANANVIITVSRKRIGSCSVLPSGRVYNGRQNREKNAVELVMPVGEHRARVESWHINATVKNPQ